MPNPSVKTNEPTDLQSVLTAYRSRVETALERRLPPDTQPPTHLHRAMRYAVLGGGKRVRPVLVYTTGEALGAALEALDAPACAVEAIHAYSLVHDDLPAMDDDDLRRGRPTCHKAFDEPTAILAGDALQTLAFQIIARDTAMTVTAATRLRMIDVLAEASGSRGMVGGQAIDLAAVGQSLNQAELENMHLHKTGALIRASVALGALAGGADEAALESLDRYAKAIGLAFQVRDDILDIEGSTDVIGKTRGADVAREKPTYPALLGLDGAKRVARELHEVALDSLSSMGSRTDALRWLSEYIVAREA